jgi:glycerol-3-phosphate dehydrogenase (NAD(P)+)
VPDAPFPDGLTVVTVEDAPRDAPLIVLAVPSRTLAANAASIAPLVAADATVLSATKGIEAETGRRMSELLEEALPGRPIAALSGPNLSREVAAGKPGGTVIASHDADLEALRDTFHSELLRTYTTTDIVGVELGGALKNVVAIAAGMVDALEYGDNAKAAIITRGLAEITRLGVAAGADPLTFQGLAGIGDLMASSYSPLARNRRFGELIAGGASLEEALATIGETVEGADTIPAALSLARKLDVEMPITDGLRAIIWNGLSPEAAVTALMMREPKTEQLIGR